MKIWKKTQTNMRKILNQKKNMKKQISGNSWTKKRIWKEQIWGKCWTKKIIWEKKKQKNPEPEKENCEKMHGSNKICIPQVEKFGQQIRQDSYFISTVCHWCLYKCSVKLFEYGNIIISL